MECRPLFARFFLLALALLAGCTVQHTGQKADATFFGGTEPVSFKLRLGKQDVLHALDLIELGADTRAICAPAGARAACDNHFDSEDCGDFTSWQSNTTLVSAALGLLAEAPFRKRLRNALRDSTFEIVETLEADAKHKIALAPIGNVFEPIRYLRPALEKKSFLAAIVFHENAHVTGMTDDELRGGHPAHDVLSAAGLCVQKMARAGEASDAGTTSGGSASGTTSSSGGSGSPGNGVPSAHRNYTGRYDFKIGNVNHVLTLDQNEHGVITGEISGIPGVVGSGMFSGQVTRLNGAQDQLEMNWPHDASYFIDFSGAMDAASGSGEARGTGLTTQSWTMTPATSLFSETFAVPGSALASLASRNPWATVSGEFRIAFGQAMGLSPQFDTINVAKVNGLSRENGTVSAFVAVSSNSTKMVGVAARVKANGDHYSLRLFKHDSSHLKVEFWRTVGGSPQKYGSHTFNSSDPRGELALQVSGGTQRAFWNGVLLQDKTDSNIGGAGSFGIFSDNNESQLNTVRVAP